MNRKTKIIGILLILITIFFLKVYFVNEKEVYSIGKIYHRWTRLPFTGRITSRGEKYKRIDRYSWGLPSGIYEYYADGSLYQWGNYIKNETVDSVFQSAFNFDEYSILRYCPEVSPNKDTTLTDVNVTFILKNRDEKLEADLKKIAEDSFTIVSEHLATSDLKEVNIKFEKSFIDTDLKYLFKFTYPEGTMSRY